jgi:hypothetical protein
MEMSDASLPVHWSGFGAQVPQTALGIVRCRTSPAVAGETKKATSKTMPAPRPTSILSM